MKVLNYVDGNVQGKTKEVDIHSLQGGLNLKPVGMFFVPMRIDEGYLFFRRNNGKPGCYFQRGTKTISVERDSFVEILFEDLFLEKL